MNRVIFKGRLAKDVELRATNSGTEIANSTIAVNRSFKKEGQPDSDFFGIIAFGKTASFFT